jgi:soluble lytic murein transglycosylase-like protein
MHQTRFTVPSPPSAIRVALIWLSLSVASLAGFASAKPTIAATEPPPSAESPVLGAQSGLLAGEFVGAQPHQLPIGTSRWSELVADYFTPSDVNLALRVMHCESSGRPDAVNAASGAAGLFQHLPSYWEDRALRADVEASIFDAEANVAVASWLVYEGGGWRHWNASRHCWSERSPLR